MSAQRLPPSRRHGSPGRRQSGFAQLSRGSTPALFTGGHNGHWSCDTFLKLNRLGMEQELESDPCRKFGSQTTPHRVSNFSPLLPLSLLNTRWPAQCCILSPPISFCMFCPWTTHIQGHKPHTWNKELRGRYWLDKIKKSEPGLKGSCRHEEVSWHARTRERVGSGDALEMQEQEGPCSGLANQSSWISELQARPHKTRWLADAEWHTSFFSGLHMHVHTCTSAHTQPHKHIYIQKKMQIRSHLAASSKVRQISTLRPRFSKLLKIHKRNLF